MVVAVKESFEHAVEEAEQVLGLGPTSIQREEALAKFRGLPFWIWDKKSHQKRFDETSIDGGITGRCCYNHVLSLPSKLGVTHPLYASYQKSVIDGLIQHRRIAVAKPRSAGISELLLRWAEYIALRDDSLKGHQIIIISAPSQNLSLSFLRRIRAHLEPHLGPFTTNQNVIQVGGVRYEVLPSHNLRTLRGRDRIGMVIIEESDFWNKNEEDELLPIVLPFIQKSNPYLAMVSTPGRKGSLMERMFSEDLHSEEEAKQYSLFHKIKIDYRDVPLFSAEDIRQAMQQPNFKREFGGEWG